MRPSEDFPPQGAEPVLLDVAEGVVTFTAASSDSVSVLSVSLLSSTRAGPAGSRAAGLALLQSDSDSQSVRNVHEEHDGGLTVAFVQCSTCSSGRCSSTAPVDTEEEPVHLCSRSQQLEDTSRAQSRTREKWVT